MKKLVWLSGLLLLLSFAFPHGLPLPVIPSPVPTPVAPDDKPVGPVDPTIAALLASAPAADKWHVAGTYQGLINVLTRDAGKQVKTTEQWATLQANTLKLAVDGTPLKGKYEGLDAAIEAVFSSKLGKEKEVVPADPAVLAKIVEACGVIIESAK